MWIPFADAVVVVTNNPVARADESDDANADLSGVVPRDDAAALVAASRARAAAAAAAAGAADALAAWRTAPLRALLAEVGLRAEETTKVMMKPPIG